jgi:alpha-L-rhamnosidase
MHDALSTPGAGVGAQPVRPASWTAQMVRPLADQGVGRQASFLRKVFELAAVSGDEQLRISAQGLYRCFINGRRVGNDLMTPGWTCYDQRLPYQTYDVGAHLQPGRNVIDIWLGDGWYRSAMLWPRNQIENTWGDKVAAIAEIHGAGGASPLLVTDASWTSGLLPILKSGIYFGEIYDARQENLPASSGVAALPFDKAVLLPAETNAVRELEPLAAIGSFTDAEGRTIFDFGQNSGGYVAIEVEGEAGARVAIEHAEILDKHGQFDRASMRAAEARIEYVLKGRGTESYRPHFTFQGFRYARVSIEGGAALRRIVSVPISSAIRRMAAFSSANPLVNRLVENTVWSQRANFIEVPTDCPQRDERLGWTGDAQVFAPTACYLHDSEKFLRKWLRDVMADQRPDGAIAHVTPDPTRGHEDILPGFYGSTGWGDAICVIPWTLWIHYGDRSVLEETLPAMVKWVDFVWSISGGPIVSPPRAWGARGFTFGDWLQPSGPSVKPLPTIGDDAAATIYLYISSVLTAKAARVVGKGDIAMRMEERAAAVKAAFAKEFVTASGRLAYDDQTSYALAILHDLVPPEHLEAAKRHFKATIARSEGRIGTGFIGTPALLPALLKIGESELAAAVFLQEEVPGWLYQVKTGATTIWERWDAIMPDGSTHPEGMNSYNHYAYGAVCQWLFEAVAGFRPDPEIPGFKHIVFEPVIVPSLSPVAAHHDSAAGRIEASWALEGEIATYRVVVPEGCIGTLVLAPNYQEISVDGAPLGWSGGTKATRSQLAPGSHIVMFRISRP